MPEQHSPVTVGMGGCLLPPRFLTVCAVNAQTCLNCYREITIKNNKRKRIGKCFIISETN
ncbi:hypothetical protein HMPREF1548_01063 [Clostridium sp. KLE 1755]|nr:hypothetical protein HMPREF1548_01063 [Clostridium sp. KLE 1755]